MNKLKTLLTTSLLVGGLNSALALEFSEHYTSKEGGVDIDQTLHYKNTDRYPFSKKCYNTAYFREARISYLDNFIVVQDAHIYVEAPTKEVYNRKSKKCVSSEPGYDYRAILRRKLSEHPMVNVEQRIEFSGLSLDGTGLRADITIQSNDPQDFFPSGPIRASIQFNEIWCKDKYGNYLAFNQNNEVSARDIITQLRQRQDTELEKCTMAEPKGSVNTYLKRGQIGISSSYHRHILKDMPNTILVTDRTSHYGQVPSLLAQWVRVGEPQDPESVGKARAAVKEFLRLISEDYGDLLYDLAVQETNDRDEVVKAFFEQNGDRILELLDEVETRFPHLTMLEKLTTAWSIKNMYLDIARLESMGKISGRLSLDRVIRRRP